MSVRTLALAVIALLAVGSACVPSPRLRYSVAVEARPPAPYDEYVPEPPGPGYAWVSGHWWWDGMDWIWVRGRYAAPPETGYVWVRPGWVHDGGTYVFVHGRWAHPARRPAVQYVYPRPRVHVRPGQPYERRPARVRRNR